MYLSSRTPCPRPAPGAQDGGRRRRHGGQNLLTLAGPAREIITGERTALNFLQRMSGIATTAAAFAEAVTGLPARILDTRKTAPGLRALDKAAVAAGGVGNHRLDLAAMVLLKENHIAAAGGVRAAIAAVHACNTRGVAVEVEVESTALPPPIGEPGGELYRVRHGRHRRPGRSSFPAPAHSPLSIAPPTSGPPPSGNRVLLALGVIRLQTRNQAWPPGVTRPVS
jgi:hypothetical protein